MLVVVAVEVQIVYAAAVSFVDLGEYRVVFEYVEFDRVFVVAGSPTEDFLANRILISLQSRR